jgi:hypothetical protein
VALLACDFQGSDFQPKLRSYLNFQSITILVFLSAVFIVSVAVVLIHQSRNHLLLMVVQLILPSSSILSLGLFEFVFLGRRLILKGLKGLLLFELLLVKILELLLIRLRERLIIEFGRLLLLHLHLLLL